MMYDKGLTSKISVFHYGPDVRTSATRKLLCIPQVMYWKDGKSLPFHYTLDNFTVDTKN